MSPLPEQQWLQMYPNHTIPYSEYVRQINIQEGVAQPAPAQQAQAQQDSAIWSPVQGKPIFNNSKFSIQGTNVNVVNPDGTSWSMPKAQLLGILPPGSPTQDWLVGMVNSAQPAQPAQQAQQSNLPTFSVWYNQQRQSNPGISVADAQAQYAKLTQQPTQNNSTNQSVTYIPPPANMQGGDPSNTGTPVTQSQGATYNAGSTTPTNQTVNGQPVSGTSTNNDAALQALINSPAYQGLPPDQQTLLRMVVQNWNPNSEINMSNVLAEFDRIKSSTIDPYFAEQVSTFTKNIQQQFQTLQEARAQELEVQGLNQQNAVKESQANLEGSGMTFSGEANRQLGNKSAYIPFQGQPEGLVNTSNRLMASSSLARNQANIRTLGLAAEQSLGNQMGSGLVPGYSPLGVSVGSIQQNKQQQLGNTLTSLAGQNQNLNQYKQPIDFTQFRNIFS